MQHNMPYFSILPVNLKAITCHNYYKLIWLDWKQCRVMMGTGISAKYTFIIIVYSLLVYFIQAWIIPLLSVGPVWLVIVLNTLSTRSSSGCLWNPCQASLGPAALPPPTSHSVFLISSQRAPPFFLDARTSQCRTQRGWTTSVCLFAELRPRGESTLPTLITNNIVSFKIQNETNDKLNSISTAPLAVTSETLKPLIFKQLSSTILMELKQ